MMNSSSPKYWRLFVAVLMWCINSCTSVYQPFTPPKGEVFELSIQQGAVSRAYILYIPDNLPPKAPLVFVLHGHTQKNEWVYEHSNMNLAAKNHSFAVCYPQGSLSKRGQPHWNADLEISDTDDVQFLIDLAQNLQLTYGFDTNRTFCCGFSNGGFMSYTLACRAPNIFRAIASVSGTMSGKTWNTCQPNKPIPILQIHGLEDNVVPINGSMTVDDGWGGAPPMDSVVKFWAALNHCDQVSTRKFSPQTYATYYKSKKNNHEVWYYKIVDLKHGWPSLKEKNGCDASEVIWAFFSRF